MKTQWIYLSYQILVLLILLLMSIQDIRHRTLSKKARLWFLPVVLFSAYPAFLLSKNGSTVLFNSLTGAALGFGLAEAFNLVLRNKNGGRPLFGGADVWLFGFLGFIYGWFGSLMILLLSNVFYGIAAAVIRGKTKAERVPLPLIPFLTLSAVVCATVQIYLSGGIKR